MTDPGAQGQPAGDLPRMPESATPPQDVPVFDCVVYVARDEAGTIHARVANLSGLVEEAASEREALEKLVRRFKAQVAQLVQSGTPVPWIEPTPPRADEQTRYIPVHL